MKKILVVLFSTLFLSACSESQESKDTESYEKAEIKKAVDVYNVKSLANPQVIGKTPSGGIVYRSHIKFICETCGGYYPEDHYVYMVNGSTSNNYSYRSGKTTTQKVEVVLNESPTPEQVIAEGERLRKSIEDAELEALAQLKAKYPNK